MYKSITQLNTPRGKNSVKNYGKNSVKRVLVKDDETIHNLRDELMDLNIQKAKLEMEIYELKETIHEYETIDGMLDKTLEITRIEEKRIDELTEKNKALTRQLRNATATQGATQETNKPITPKSHARIPVIQPPVINNSKPNEVSKHVKFNLPPQQLKRSMSSTTHTYLKRKTTDNKL